MSAKGGAQGLTTRTLKPVEPVDPQLSDGRVIPLGDVVKATFESGSDLVMLGDTDHYDRQIIDLLESEEVARGAAEGGATHRLIEAGKDEPTTLNMQKNTAGYGMELHKVDTMSGEEKRNRPKTPELNQDFLMKRLQDDRRELPRNIREVIPEGEKGLISYGAGHFSMTKTPGRLAEMNMVKIDIYADREAYNEDREAIKRFNESLKSEGRNLRFGENVPEAVYFIDKGTIYMTRDTPDWLRSRLETMGTVAPAANAAPVTPAPVPESAPPPSVPGAPAGP